MLESLNKNASCMPSILKAATQVFSRECCKIFDNNFYKTHRNSTAAHDIY